MVTVTVGGRNNQECGRSPRRNTHKKGTIIDFDALQSQIHDAVFSRGMVEDSPFGRHYVEAVVGKIMREHGLGCYITFGENGHIDISPFLDEEYSDYWRF